MSATSNPLALEFRRELSLVEASAGTGKTFTLARLALRALLEGEVDDVSQLLVVTFTNAAAAELHHRIREQVREALDCLRGVAEPTDEHFATLLDAHRSNGVRILRKALIEFDEICVSTIHGFCSRTLDVVAFESGVPFRTELVDEHREAMSLAARDFWRNEIGGRNDVAASIAGFKKWSPDAFLRDYRASSRYQNTVILPEAVPLEDARVRITAEADAVRAAWNESELRNLLQAEALLGPKGDLLSPETAPALLDAAASFCEQGELANAGTVLTFASDALELRLRKKSNDEKFARDRILADPFPVACEQLAAATGAFHHALRAACIRDVGTQLQAETAQGRVLSYDDLLGRLRTALGDRERSQAVTLAVRSRFRVALIDEFQDTDLTQYDVFRHLFEDRPLIIVGDPKQAIYGFRGADVFAYLEAKKDARSTATLTTNRRSTPKMISAVNALFERSHRPFIYPDIEFKPVGPPTSSEIDNAPLRDELYGDTRAALCWLSPPQRSSVGAARNAIAEGVAAEVAALLEGPTRLDGIPVRPSDIAILARKNDTGRAIRKKLGDLGIPTVVSQGNSVFASEEATEIETIIAAIAHPSDARAVTAALATRIWGLNAAEIRDVTTDDTRFEEIYVIFERARTLWSSRGFPVAMEFIFTKRETEQRLLESSLGQRRVTNTRQLVQLCHDVSHTNRYSPDDLRVWLAQARDPERDDRKEEYEEQLESDEDAVRITTIHKAKGLEYEIVFCPDLWESGKQWKANHDPELVHVDGKTVALACDLDSKNDLATRATAERLAEQSRLTYVALTRSRRRCYVVAFPMFLKPNGKTTRYGEFHRSALAYDLLGKQDLDLDSELDAPQWCEQALAFADDPARDWEGMIAGLVDANREVMEMTELKPPRDTVVNMPAAARPKLTARVFSASIDRLEHPARIASFSTLANSSGAGDRERPDHDAIPTVTETSDATTTEDVFAFEKGARAGTCLHDIFEHAAFGAWQTHDEPDTAPPDDHTRELIDATLARYGLASDESNRAAASKMLFHTLRAPVPGGDGRLCDTDENARLVEWQFYLPVDALRPAAMADVFANHGRDRVATEYAPLLTTLDPKAVRGHMTGFVDLVFESENRWYVVDWKSNHLGNQVEQYGDAGVWKAMCDHDYILQYHLYTVGLHRFLASRLPDYDYESHFGGVYYAFLRGIREHAADPDTGWYHDRPPFALIDALDKAISTRRAA